MECPEDYTGRRFSKLTVIERCQDDKNSWKCLCDCGGHSSPKYYNLDSSNSKSCGKCRTNENIRNFEGKTFTTKGYGEFCVNKYVSAAEVHITFIQTGTKFVCNFKEVRNKAIKDPFYPSVSGVGFLGAGTYLAVTYLDGLKKNTQAYEVWNGILKRCYNEKWQKERTTGAYDDCSVAEEWHNFQNFAEWYYSQRYAGWGFAVDKDLRVFGNRVYSPEFCSLVPEAVNSLFTGSNERTVDRELPKGIHLCDSKKLYIAQIHCGELTKNGNKKQTYLGQYVNKLDALKAYKVAKERHVKEVANKFKDVLHVEVYNNLMNFEVGITD